MAVLMQARVPGMTDGLAAGIGTPEFLEQIREFPGFGGFFSQGPVDGGWMVTEVWESAEAHERWVQEVISARMPAEVMSTVEITVTALTQVEIS
ncbi:MAG: antibiotic biosynthesis monooxygenase [Acidimicrobiia bacterium]|nr:antibiotic biosynthesis monooxygenase [Acidimicrobiia bacterium]MDH3470513.1 antibiotic biosynthesis monooxygenase [Acidimicrobiia bacterium]